MQVENHKEEVPFEYYAELFSKADAQEMAERTGTNFDGEKFYVNLLGVEYAISYPTAAFTPGAALPVQTFLLRWLLEGKKVSWQGNWKTFREMPWGELYIKPYTGRVLTRAAFTFGFKLEKFCAACEKMGAVAVKHGDAGYQLQLLPGFWMQIMVWEGDDEFPPNAQVIYSDNFAEGFAAEDRVVAGDILISTIKANM
jgi:hypothetical protein